MTKRISAVVIAMLLVLTSMLMTACKTSKPSDDESDDESTEESSKNSGGSLFAPFLDKIDKDVTSDLKNEGSKELVSNITASLGNITALKNDGGLGDASEMVTSGEDLKLSLNIDIDELSVDGEGLPTEDPASLDMTLGIDIDNVAAELDFTAELAGDSLTASAIANLDGVYLTEIAGMHDKPIFVTYEEIGLDISELETAFEEFDEVAEYTEAQMDAMIVIIDALVVAIDNNVTDDDFVSTTENLTINGVTYENANVLTLTVDNEMFKAVLLDFFTALEGNEAVEEYLYENFGFEDIDAEEIANEFYLDGTFEIKSYTIGEETVAITIDAIDNSTNEVVLFINCHFVDENINIKCGKGEKAFEFVYTLDGEEEFIEFNMLDGEVSDNFIRIKGTYKDGTHKGTLFINSEEDSIAIGFELKITETSVKFTINNIKLDEASYDMTLSFEAKVTKNKISYTFEIDADIDNIVINASFTIGIENTDLDIIAPESYDKYTDLTEADFENWAANLEKNLPNIYELLTAVSEPEYDDYYGDGYYGDDYYDEYYDDFDYGYDY